MRTAIWSSRSSAPLGAAIWCGGPTTEAAEARRAEVLDLAGVARDHLTDAMAGALAVPLVTESHTIPFAPEVVLARRNAPSRATGPREPGAAARRAGRSRRRADRCSSPRLRNRPDRTRWRPLRLDGRGRLGEYLQSSEAAIVRDALQRRRGRTAADLHDSAVAQSDRAVRFRGRIRRSIRSTPAARRADEPRLRGRVPAVHRARGRRRAATASAQQSSRPDRRSRPSVG